MQNLNMPLEQAFSIISQALAQANSNREGHALMQTAENRIKEEIANLQAEVRHLGEHHETCTHNSNTAPIPSNSNFS